MIDEKERKKDRMKSLEFGPFPMGKFVVLGNPPLSSDVC